VSGIALAAARRVDVAALIDEGPDEAACVRLRRAESMGRPLVGEPFMRHLETLTGRSLTPHKQGPRSRKV
jgi:hypothetical protein